MLETARELPLGSKIGFGVMVLGTVADLIAHLGSAVEHVHVGASGPAFSAHPMVFVGMALVLTGVVVDGVRAARRSDGGGHGR
jgi:hypothetical protein